MATLRPAVVLVCGASGVGKTRVAVPLAARIGAPLCEADDLVTALTALTTPRQQPLLHYWETHPGEAATLTPVQIAALSVRIGEALGPAFRAVIADHLAFDAPVVIEGDFLLPDLAAEAGPRVRAVVLSEPDPAQIVANFLNREPDAGRQTRRAAASTAHGARLTERARALGVPVVPSRPHRTALERSLRALGAAAPAAPPPGTSGTVHDS